MDFPVFTPKVSTYAQAEAAAGLPNPPLAKLGALDRAQWTKVLGLK